MCLKVVFSDGRTNDRVYQSTPDSSSISAVWNDLELLQQMSHVKSVEVYSQELLIAADSSLLRKGEIWTYHIWERSV